MPTRYQNIDAATIAMGYGTLIGDYAKRHAFGSTTAGCTAWLPIMYDHENNWYNMYGSNDSKELIIQIANGKTAMKDWRDGALVQDVAHVIVRTSFDGEKYEYEDIGEYCTILFDPGNYLSIHAKVGSPVTLGQERHGNRISWVSGFAASENEARAKLDKLAGSTLKVLKEPK
ncbi:hypothetical protein FACS189479_03480 [Spirochaetia bacterium]|nr:hypothetical protein FACS189479_03480 [Spirochaetia bacterium]